MVRNGIPTRWQNVIYRNYGTVPVKNLAAVLKTDEDTVKKQARALGMGGVTYNSDWLTQGFVTIIRNNWDLLPNEDICTLLGIPMSELNRQLKDFDFLDVKLGQKLPLEGVRYAPLTAEEESQTEKIKSRTEKNFIAPKVRPFDFYKDTARPVVTLPGEIKIQDRFTACYGGNYGDTLLDDQLKDYSEDYLKRVAQTGINGLWIHETLRNLADFPFDRRECGDYKRRMKNLKKLTERCHKYGVNIYLYLNEPRSLHESFFEKYPHLRGQKCGEHEYCLCTSAPEVQEYLYQAVKSIAEGAPLLKAIMTITMSENPTHCYSRFWEGEEPAATSCPRCKNRKAEELAAEVNNIMNRALKDGNGYTKLICNTWGWSHAYNWTDEMTLHGVELLDKDIDVLAVSEYSKEYERGGIKAKIIDYSISIVGPSETTVKTLTRAKELGHNIWAKIQVNNSWECSGVPYIPAFDLMTEHVENVKKLGVTGLMLGWSLGGFPGGALPLCTLYCADEVDEKGWYQETYGENAALMKRAVSLFSKAFTEYPFHVNVIYGGGHTLACGHLWEIEPSTRPCSMVCFTYDDYETWTNPYGLESYIRQFTLVCEGWQEGIKLLKDVSGNTQFEECKRMAEGAYIHVKSALNWANFVKYKGDLQKNRAKLLQIVSEEEEITRRLYELISTDAKIGYEMSNHYFYNANLLLEKLLNVTELKNILA